MRNLPIRLSVCATQAQLAYTSNVIGQYILSRGQYDPINRTFYAIGAEEPPFPPIITKTGFRFSVGCRCSESSAHFSELELLYE